MKYFILLNLVSGKPENSPHKINGMAWLAGGFANYVETRRYILVHHHINLVVWCFYGVINTSESILLFPPV
jgi:hypothetical protein